MKKRLVAGLCAAAFAVGGLGAPITGTGIKLIPDLAVSADEVYTYEDFEYTINSDDTVTITKYNGSDETLDIPELIDGKRVTSIGGYAFYGCTCLTNVTIPDSVISIGYGAFASCTNLVDLNLGNGVSRVDGFAFHGCTALSSVVIPYGVTSISAFTFSDSGLKSINIPDSVTIIDKGAFSGCTNLTDINIPDGVTNIDREAFAYCASLTYIIIPDNVTSISDSVFFNCRNLASIIIPNSVTNIRSSAFCFCYSLTRMTIPDSVTSIGASAFYGCYNCSDIYYSGTSGQWCKIEIDNYNDGNASLYNAIIHCSDGDIKPEESTPELEPEKQSLAKSTVTVSNKTYTGKTLKPGVTVKLDGKTLKKGTDYTVSYKNNTKCGKAAVTVAGAGDYIGTKKGSFIIKPAKVAAKKLTSPKANTIKLTWTKAKGGVTGYEVMTATNKKFTKGKKSYTIAKAGTISKTVKGLKKKTTYYAKVRAYKTVGKTKYYGAWSSIKKVKCK